MTTWAVSTGSAIVQDAFERPMSALYDAIAEATEMAAADPDFSVPSAEALAEAGKLLRMLPRDVQSPEPVVEPSGTIAWTWDRPGIGFLALAVNGSGVLQRSAFIDGARIHGRTAIADRLAPDELALLARFPVTHA
jgi:hypothetical protein